jgi:hypothetical protein
MCGSAVLVVGVVLLGGLALVGVAAGRGAVLLQLGEGAGVDGVLDARLLDGVVDGGLDALEVEDVVRFTELADLLRLELQVVRFDARLGEGGDGDAVAADLLGQELHGVERRHHVQLAVFLGGGGAGGTAAGGERDQAEGHGSGEGGGGYEASYVHGIHFQQ